MGVLGKINIGGEVSLLAIVLVEVGITAGGDLSRLQVDKGSQKGY